MQANAIAVLVEDPRRKLVQRIVASPSFVKSPRLSGFLTYVCELSLRGEAEEINEQKIGEAVFGRSLGYDPAVDGIVRTHASRLRQRLEQYFAEEGADEPLTLAIPRGGYVPVFAVKAKSVAASVLDCRQEAIDGRVQRPPERAALLNRPAARVVVFASLFFLLAGGAFLWLWRGNKLAAAGSPDTAFHPLWSRLFHAGQQSFIVPGDSALVIWQGLTEQHVALADYLSGDYRSIGTPKHGVDVKTALNLAGRRYTSIVDLGLATRFYRLPQVQKNADNTQVRYARDLRPNDLKTANVVLVGAQEANPWVEIFERNMNFVFYNSLAERVFSILNRAPQDKEPAKWEAKFLDPEHKVYGVVAFLPNLGNNGDVLILEGTSMSGTESAGDFVCDESRLRPFLETIRAKDGHIPHFELILQTNNIGGNASQSQMLAYRVRPD
jgi:hypothetical protein